MYRVSLQHFEGPLDLLLFFIKRDELDIYDIPIAQIADEFLGYVRVLEKIDLDGVGDFIYMAALLVSIKARMLLPGTETDEEGDPIDPRRELVERLLEYVRYKEAAQQLGVQQERRQERFVRGRASAPEDEGGDEEAEVDATVFDLVTALRGILTEAEELEDSTHEVERIAYTMEEQQDYVVQRLAAGEAVSFAALVAARAKAFVIATFLAVLELARQRKLRIALDTSRLDFYLERRDDWTDPPAVEPVAQNGAA